MVTLGNVPVKKVRLKTGFIIKFHIFRAHPRSVFIIIILDCNIVKEEKNSSNKISPLYFYSSLGCLLPIIIVLYFLRRTNYEYLFFINIYNVQ